MPEAAAAYQAALAIDAKYAPAHNNLGVLLERQGKREEAIAEYRAALKADPKLEDSALQPGAARPRGVDAMPAPASEAPPHFDPPRCAASALLPAPRKPQVVPAVRELVSWFAARDVAVLLHQDQAAEFGFPERGVPQAQLAEQADLLVALGGDGTLLHTARLGAPHGKPILGVNLGGFGFLASAPYAGLYLFLEEMLAGRFKLQARMMLQAEVVLEGGPVARYHALNDLVIAKGAIARLLHITTHISGEAVSDFPADGVIVATPTGSTGYALSAGGPVVDPDLRGFLITPICPHTLSARTLLVPAHRTITVTLREPGREEVHLTCDGQESMSLRGMEAVHITEAPFSAYLLGAAEDSFTRACARSSAGEARDEVGLLPPRLRRGSRRSPHQAVAAPAESR